MNDRAWECTTVMALDGGTLREPPQRFLKEYRVASSKVQVAVPLLFGASPHPEIVTDVANTMMSQGSDIILSAIFRGTLWFEGKLL